VARSFSSYATVEISGARLAWWDRSGANKSGDLSDPGSSEGVRGAAQLAYGSSNSTAIKAYLFTEVKSPRRLIIPGRNAPKRDGPMVFRCRLLTFVGISMMNERDKRLY
jgi:hypothetical protein